MTKHVACFIIVLLSLSVWVDGDTNMSIKGYQPGGLGWGGVRGIRRVAEKGGTGRREGGDNARLSL